MSFYVDPDYGLNVPDQGMRISHDEVSLESRERAIRDEEEQIDHMGGYDQ